MDYANNPDLWRQINSANIVPRLENAGLLGGGRYVDVDDKKIHKIPAIEVDANWIYVNPNPELLCMEYHAIVRGFRFIPTKCLDCYKVVVMPRSFHELVLLYELELEMVRENPRCWCKLGTEERTYVPRDYGGYFYNRGLESGKTRYKTVRQAVSEKISPDVDVILKRYCTEFEMQFGPSDKYEQPKGAKEIEKYFWQNIDVMTGARTQPEFICHHTIQKWMDFAWGRGDKTVMLYNGGKPLVPPPVTYQGKE